MARATFVQKARKDVAGTDIKAGDSYYWWKFRFGGKHYSKTAPKRSQLTQSNFYSQLWDIEDDIGTLEAGDGLESDVADIAQRLRDLAQECTDARDNMPEQLQDSDTGTMLQERAEACEAAADELEGLDLSDMSKEDDESDEDFWQRKLDEIQAINIDAP
jgi:hypothetical protein